MSKKRKILLIAVTLIIVITGLVIKQRVDARKEQQALIRMEKPAADKLYKNFRLYITDTKKKEALDEKYNEGKGSITKEEYLKEELKLRQYIDIKTIRFTKVYSRSDEGVHMFFMINNVYFGEVYLTSKEFDTDDKEMYEVKNWKYKFEPGEESDGYTLVKKEKPTTESIPKDKVTYYIGWDLEDELGIR